MGLIETFNGEFKDALKGKDKARLDVLRMIRSRVTERTTAKGFKGEVDDALYQDVIGTYVNQLKKGIEELTGGGGRSEEIITGYTWEIDYLSRYLPTLLGPEETRALVQETIAATGADSAKQIGRVMGTIMKSHKGQVDGNLVRSIAQELLGG